MKTTNPGVPIQQLVPQFNGPGVYKLSENDFARLNAKAIPPQTHLRVYALGDTPNWGMTKTSSGWKASVYLTYFNEPASTAPRLLRNLVLIAAARGLKQRGAKVQCTAYEPQMITVWVANQPTGAEVLAATRMAIMAICDEAGAIFQAAGPELQGFAQRL